MKKFLNNLLFVFISSAVLVFFSEKAYWYVQGFEVGGLILYYAVPTAASLWALQAFRVHDLSGVVLVGTLFAFLVEGVLTPVIYEAGLLDPVMPAYFIGWHGLLSVVFGWYLLRRWLVEKRWKRLLLTCLIFGLFWGVWSLTFWLPENIAEFEALAAAGEPARPGQWTPIEFAFYALLFTLMLMTGHWLLGRGIWKSEFRLSTPGKVVLAMVLVGLFVLQVLLILPLAFLKLTALLLLVFLPLAAHRRRQSSPPLLTSLQGRAGFLPLLTLLVMPAAASLVYWLSFHRSPGMAVIQDINELTPFLQGLVGVGAYLWAAGSQFLRQPDNPRGQD